MASRVFDTAKMARDFTNASGVVLRLKGILASLIWSLPTGYALFFFLSHVQELQGASWVAEFPLWWSACFALFGAFYAAPLVRFTRRIRHGIKKASGYLP